MWYLERRVTAERKLRQTILEKRLNKVALCFIHFDSTWEGALEYSNYNESRYVGPLTLKRSFYEFFILSYFAFNFL